MKYFHEPVSEIIWDIKYRYRYHNKVIDKTPEATFERVAKAVAKTESLMNRKHWQKQFSDILESFHFLPGGRILAGAGTKHQVTLFNCFVMPIKEDSLSGIFSAIHEGALTLQQGGGVGYDFSTLRPKGFIVKKTDATASGPVSFMRIWDAMCATMLSTGARRGAMMGILRCDHPDIEEFIKAKANAQELRHFNVSVLISDAFMHAVRKNTYWNLVFPSGRRVRKIHARTLWENIMLSAYTYAEPGVLFEDTINRMNTLSYCEKITATNPCGEIPLPEYGACNLGSLNLTQFIMNPFSDHAKINWKKLESHTQIATRFLDNVIDVSSYPLLPQKKQALQTRRIGLGYTGLADSFVMLGIKYGSKESLKLAAQISKCISEITWKTSIELAEEKKSFPLFHSKKYLATHFVKRLPDDIRKMIKKLGMRNSHHNTLAPTGTISLLANNVSNGIEPIFSSRYDRTIRFSNGELQKFTIQSYALKMFQEKTNSRALPPVWIDAQSLMPEDHLHIQSAIQPYIDNAISKTINIPENFPFKKLSYVYQKAYELGLKGCTIFRPNPVTGSVLACHPDECK